MSQPIHKEQTNKRSSAILRDDVQPKFCSAVGMTRCCHSCTSKALEMLPCSSLPACPRASLSTRHVRTVLRRWEISQCGTVTGVEQRKNGRHLSRTPPGGPSTCATGMQETNFNTMPLLRSQQSTPLRWCRALTPPGTPPLPLFLSPFLGRHRCTSYMTLQNTASGRSAKHWQRYSNSRDAVSGRGEAHMNRSAAQRNAYFLESSFHILGRPSSIESTWVPRENKHTGT